MSADSPPTYYFTGIQFNSSFYNDASTAPLTQPQATALFLLKNTADTATALETFTGGILTNTINGVVSATGAISIGASQTDGILNLGTGTSRTATGDINIATGASNTCDINIMNGNTTGGSVNIANGTGVSQSTVVNIGSGSTTGTVTIGNNDNAIALNGAVTLAKPLILGTAPTLATQLGFTYPVTSTVSELLNITANGNTGISYSPATGNTTNYLVQGTYLISSYNFTFFQDVTSANMNVRFGVLYSATTTPSGTTSFGQSVLNAVIVVNPQNFHTYPAFPTFCINVVTAGYYYTYTRIEGVSGFVRTGTGYGGYGGKTLSITRIA